MVYEIFIGYMERDTVIDDILANIQINNYMRQHHPQIKVRAHEKLRQSIRTNYLN